MGDQVPEILGEQVVHRYGPLVRVKRWYRGVHPNLGIIVFGFTGLETMQEVDVIRPWRFFRVY